MKKKILLSLFMLVSMACYSQKVTGTFSLPESEKFLNIKWDWSKAVINKKLNEQEWATVVGEKTWEEAKYEVLLLIAREMNEKLANSRIMIVSPENDTKTACTLYITPLKYEKKGRNDTQYILVDNETGDQIGQCEDSGDGGKIGSVGNLLGDGYKKAAQRVAGVLRKYNKVKK